MELLIKLWVVSIWVVAGIGYYKLYKIERDHLAGVVGFIIFPIAYFIICFILSVTYSILSS